MPTNTFFRLPEEKRQRLMDAAWEEFTRTGFNDVSINRIIQNAHIPRGSFYQYFEDKGDLFSYLLMEGKAFVTSKLTELLRENDGDLYAVPLQAFDWLLHRDGNPEEFLSRWIRIVRVNPGLDCRALFTEEPGHMPEEARQLVDTGMLKDSAQVYVDTVFFLLVSALALAVVETLQEPEQWENQRNILRQKIEIIQYGSSAPGDLPDEK